MAVILLLRGAIGHMVLWVPLINRSHAWVRHWVNLITLVCLAGLIFLPPLVLWGITSQTGDGKLPPLAAIIAWCYIDACVVVCIVSAIQRLYWWRHPDVTPLCDRIAQLTFDCRLPAIHLPSAKFQACFQTARQSGAENLHSRKGIGHPAPNEQFRWPAHRTSNRPPLLRPHLANFFRTRRRRSERRVARYHRHHRRHRRRRSISRLDSAHARPTANSAWRLLCARKPRPPRATETRLRATMAAAGLINVGGQCRKVEVNGEPLIIAGNELPWYKPAADFSGCPKSEALAAAANSTRPFADQFAWAQINDVDLMLAGHLHGGTCACRLSALSPRPASTAYATFRACSPAIIP